MSELGEAKVFGSLKKAWTTSQQQLNRQQFERCILLIFETADEVTPACDPRALYVSTRAAKLRVEVILLRKWAAVDVAQIEQFITNKRTWRDGLTDPQRAAVQTVITHLKNDLQCNPPL